MVSKVSAKTLHCMNSLGRSLWPGAVLVAGISCSGDFGNQQFEGSSLLRTTSNQNQIRSLTESEDKIEDKVESSVSPGDAEKTIPMNISEQMVGSTLKVNPNTFERPVTLKVSKSDTLALDQDISLLDLGSQLKMNDSSVSVDFVIDSEQGEHPELKSPMIAKFRIKPSGEGLSLRSPDNQFIIVYKNFDKNGTYVGVIGKNELQYQGEFVLFEVRKFGSYQLASVESGFYNSFEQLVPGQKGVGSTEANKDSGKEATQPESSEKSAVKPEIDVRPAEESLPKESETADPREKPPETSPQPVRLTFKNLDQFLQDSQDQFVEIRSVYMDKCLTLPITRRLQEEEGSYLVFETCDQRAGQKFKLFNRGNNLFSIKTDQDTCVDIQESSYFSHAPVLGYGCHYEGNQTFQLSSTGELADKFNFMALHSELCLQDQASAMEQFNREDDRDDDQDDDRDKNRNDDKVEYDGFLQNNCNSQNPGQQFELNIYKNSL